jgi:phosphatidate cytidylyltransferase
LALGNLASRFLVAVVAVPILLVVLYLQPAWPTFFLVGAAALIAMHEFFSMTLEDKTDRTAGLIFGGLACAAAYWMNPGALPAGPRWQSLSTSGYAVSFLSVIAPALYFLFRFGDIASVAKRFAYMVTGIVYAGLLFMALAGLKRDFGGGTTGGHMVVLVLAIAWLGDTGAYFAGRFLGNAKLYPAVSPKKTWAGAWGGLAGSLGAAIVMKLFFLQDLGWLDTVLIAAPGAALGQMGDLAESLIKRSTGVKDSGSLLPGHGGILDRVDAVLFIGPYLLVYIQIRAAIG